MSILLLLLSVVLSTVRNLFSKGISNLHFGTKKFFFTQAVIFACGGVILSLVTSNPFDNVSYLTLLIAALYSILLLTAQYCYTSALKNGNIGICSTVYSLGFIFPTLSGNLFWRETLTVSNILGILLVIPTIIISGMKPSKNIKTNSASKYIFPLTAAMISSGGLGILQKVQQNSPYPEQKNFFVIFAFAMAAVISLIFSLFAKSDGEKLFDRKIITAAGTGIAFAFSNLFNTILAGLLESALFFPVLNISTIIFSLLAGIVFYKEKISKRDFTVLLLGILAILLITAA